MMGVSLDVHATNEEKMIPTHGVVFLYNRWASYPKLVNVDRSSRISLLLKNLCAADRSLSSDPKDWIGT